MPNLLRDAVADLRKPEVIEEIRKLPNVKDSSYRNHTCPVAQYLSQRVGQQVSVGLCSTSLYYEDGTSEYVNLPDSISDLIMQFDQAIDFVEEL